MDWYIFGMYDLVIFSLKKGYFEKQIEKYYFELPRFLVKSALYKFRNTFLMIKKKNCWIS